jgi:hypothetical protein
LKQLRRILILNKMKTALLLLILQGILGAFDTLYYHEYRLRLPSAFAARKELKLHAARDFIYAIIFGSLAWRSWDGLWAWVLVGLFVTELVITLWDFLAEDRSRKVPARERSTHAIMGIVYGAVLANLLPEILRWGRLPTGFVQHDYVMLSWILSVMAFGVFVSGLRDILAVRRLGLATGSAEFARI